MTKKSTKSKIKNTATKTKTPKKPAPRVAKRPLR